MTRRPGRLARRLALATAICAIPAFTVPAIAAAELGDKTLKRGDSGTDVKQLQRALNDAGYRTSVDGEFGANTVKRVRAFEGNEQLRVDGKVTPSDARRLKAAPQRGPGGEEENPTGGQAPDHQDQSESAPGGRATVGSDGFASAPAGAPEEVREAIDAGNEIAKKPYKYGGGHGQMKDSGYDCSGSISYVLRKAGLMKRSMASGEMASYGDGGKGKWITLYANSGHAYMVIAGVRFDTSARKQEGSRWSDTARSSRGYTARHPEGF